MSRPDPRFVALALHSSGAGARQWQAYPSLIDPAWRWLAPDLLGYDAAASWPLGRQTSIDAEAGHVAAALGATGEAPVHLVGHSYGGTVALQLALRRPDRVASLTVYEPVRFALLQHGDGALWRDIVAAGRHIGALALAGRLDASAQAFVDYWSGVGTWQRLSTGRRAAVVQRMPKVQAEFEALFADGEPIEAYRALTMPLRIVCGTASPAPARRVAERLAEAVRGAELVRWADADHMAPLTQPERFAALLPCAARAAQEARLAA
jgi:pimeloyl-ACP methyl ester carboxylesterase